MRTAQTYPQLTVQLERQEWSPDDLALVRRAFELAATLFAAAERGSGKPFIDHLVGTASGVILAGGDPDEVAAAVLHAAYDQGDFGDGRTGPLPKHRRCVCSAVGEPVEMLVYRYHSLGWSRDVAVKAAGNIGSLDDTERSVLLIRSANELDDAIDGGLVVSGKQRQPVHSREVHEATARLAEALGDPPFGALVRETLLGDPPHVPPELVLNRVVSRTRLPLSASGRLWPRMVETSMQVRRSRGRAMRRIRTWALPARRGSRR